MTAIEKGHKHPAVVRQGGGGGSDAVYGIGIIGAWVFYFKRATTNQERVMAFLKGLVWPAFLVYELFGFLEKAAPAPSGEAKPE